MISINLPKAKAIAHNIRREQRAQEFEPLDQAIAKQIPGTDVPAVEAQRQLIRDKYAALQASIDAATDSDGLLTLVQNI